MNFVISNLSIILALVIYACVHFYNRWIHKHNAWFFIVAFILSILVVFIEIPFFSLLIDKGHLSLGIFLLVMFAGVLRKKWIVYKKLLLIRGDLAILGFIFLIPHGVHRLSLALSGYQSTGLIAAIIMIPLTISSFMFIRKKIRPDRWKKLHKLAYIAYLMIYIHLGFDINFNLSNFYISFGVNSILYHLLFLIYIVLKIYRNKGKNPTG
jgi:DMSO/TMAO reductase YedYZ heme-binding membrane subunit